jgi:hypothetical protein
MQKVGEKVEENIHEQIAQPAILERLSKIYDEKTVLEIAETHGLSTFYKSLEECLRNAGSLFLRYGTSNDKVIYDLAPKLRTVARTAEIARNFDEELYDLDFWDRWQIFKLLENTGHPVVDSLDSYTKADPLIAGNIVIEELRLILKAIIRFESSFFEALSSGNKSNLDIGLFFFVQVIGTYWKSLTGKQAFSDSQGANITPEALAFLSDCITPLAEISAEEITKIAKAALHQ